MKQMALVLAAVLFISPTLAFAYELPAPITTQNSFSGGTGEVDFTKSSSVEGTIKIDSVDGESVWVTAGDIASGKAGYGFFIHDDKLFGVTRMGQEEFQHLLPLGFVRPNTEITVKAVYTPGEAVRFDTSAFEAYSRGIVMDYIPGAWLRGLGAFNASVQSKNNPANLFVGTWKYSQ